MDLQLKGRTAIVTGASAGIGAGIAECLAREGTTLALAGRNRAALEKVAAQARSLGAPPVHVVVGDVTTLEGAHAIADEGRAALGGRVDILINNVGSSRPLKGEETEAFWAEALDLNFSSARRVTGRIVPGMKAAGFGRIVNITGALYGKAINGAAPSKAALLSWSRALAFELAPHGITVNCVAPGRINSVQILQRLHPTDKACWTSCRWATSASSAAAVAARRLARPFSFAGCPFPCSTAIQSLPATAAPSCGISPR